MTASGARCALSRSFAVAFALLSMASANAQESARACLPADLELRVAFAEPKQLTETLGELTNTHSRAGKRAVLRQRFEEAGCATIEEQGGRGSAEPNLICRLPGTGEETIAIASSPAFDGWTAAALLPEVARALAAAPREHGYAIAVLSRSNSETPSGARAFAESFGLHSPIFFVHLGMLGSRLPMIGPGARDERVCEVEAVARAVSGASLGTIGSWSGEQFSRPCPGSPLLDTRSPHRASICQSSPFNHFLDTDPFVRRGVAVIGVYDFPRDGEPWELDPAAYVATYRILAAYAVALDTLLALPKAPAARATHEAGLPSGS